MLNIALVADASLAEKFIETLENHPFAEQVKSLHFVPFTPSEEPQILRFQKKDIQEENLATIDWKAFQLVFFASDVSLAQHLANAAEAGCKVIDMFGICANLEHIPLMVPSVNDHLFSTFPSCNIVSIPSAEATQAALIATPILTQQPVETLFLTSLLSAASSGMDGVNQLASQTARLLNGLPLADEEVRVAFDNRTQKGQKIAEQLMRLFPSVNVVCHSVQVPVFYGLSQSLSFSPAPRIEKTFFDNHPFITLSETMPTPVSVVTGEQNKIALALSETLWGVSDELRLLVLTMSLEIAQIFANK